MGLDKLAQVRRGRRRVSASMTGGSCLVSGASMTGGSCLISGAHSVGELTEPTKLRGATTKVAAEAVRRGGTRRHGRHEFYAWGVPKRERSVRVRKSEDRLSRRTDLVGGPRKRGDDDAVGRKGEK